MDLEHLFDIRQGHRHDASLVREMPYDVETGLGYQGIRRGPRLLGERRVFAQVRGERMDRRRVHEQLHKLCERH